MVFVISKAAKAWHVGALEGGVGFKWIGVLKGDVARGAANILGKIMEQQRS